MRTGGSIVADLDEIHRMLMGVSRRVLGMNSLVADQADIHRMAKSKDVGERREPAKQIRKNFADLLDKKQAWDDLHKLTFDTRSDVRRRAAQALGSAFVHVPDKIQALKDLHRLTSNTDSSVRWRAAEALGRAFAYVPDKIQVWEDLIRLTSDTDNGVRGCAAEALGSAFAHVPDKIQAFKDLHRLTSNTNWYVRLGVASALSSAFSHAPDKKQVWEDLIRLTSDIDSDVRASTYHSLGKVSILKAANAENDIDLKKEMETAIKFFEKSSQQQTYSKPAKFCLPFYRSFYYITFKKKEAGVEVQKYIAEAKSAIEGSESKEKLLEVVENLSNALKEAQNSQDFSEVKCDLNKVRQHCENAVEIMETTEKTAPGATRVIRKGYKIISKNISELIPEIKEKAKVACRRAMGTPAQDITCTINKEIQEWQISDQKQMTQYVEKLISSLKLKIPAIPENQHIIEKIDEIRNIKDLSIQYEKVSDLILLIPTVVVHMGDIIETTIKGNSNLVKIKSNEKIVYENSTNSDNVEIQKENFKSLKNQKFSDFINTSAIAATLSGFGTYVISETMDIIPVTNSKHQINATLAILIFFIVLFVARKYFNKSK